MLHTSDGLKLVLVQRTASRHGVSSIQLLHERFWKLAAEDERFKGLLGHVCAERAFHPGVSDQPRRSFLTPKRTRRTLSSRVNFDASERSTRRRRSDSTSFVASTPDTSASPT